ncbi:uncharacterized protein LOC118802394 [Colossoma macropomum]|uniref:uncharacterized protein LOC118802394 n=1 Tax=Colossoma macropomum TaxID=42526 RepID=UPI001864D779|nr:uncharacterized protein LOC118802394 [Colossoma macropomum]
MAAVKNACPLKQWIQRSGHLQPHLNLTNVFKSLNTLWTSSTHKGQVCGRALSYEVVDGTIAVQSSRPTANCALCDGEQFAVAHLKGEDCDRLEAGQSYYLKNYTLTEKYGQAKLFFMPSTTVFKAGEVRVSSDLEMNCNRAVHPPSQEYKYDMGRIEEYSTLQGKIDQMTTTRLQNASNGAVPIRPIVLLASDKHFDVILWREAALSDISLSQTVTITHLRKGKEELKFNSSSYTVVTFLKHRYFNGNDGGIHTSIIGVECRH